MSTHGQRFTLEVRPRIPEALQRLEELAGNLLDNAFKYTRARVAVSGESGARMTLIVEDDGPGIDGELRSPERIALMPAIRDELNLTNSTFPVLIDHGGHDRVGKQRIYTTLFRQQQGRKDLVAMVVCFN